jgi:molecular chaperone HscB
MNYFEVFDIPVQLKVDSQTLSNKYFELSRKYHPDYFVNASENEQAESLERSSLLNKAMKTLQDPDETIKYVLKLKDLLEEEEKYQLPPDFLMEVLEINEQLMDQDDPGNVVPVDTNIETRISDLQNQIYEPVKEIVENYKEGITSKEELLQVKEYYYKKKYLDRIQKKIASSK